MKNSQPAKILIGNWKQNPSTLKEAKALSKKVIADMAKVKGIEVVICPPDLYLIELKKSYKGRKVKFGAQNVSIYSAGAHTGDTSAGQLADSGAEYTIIGHSERRATISAGGHNEVNAVVAHKAKLALESKLCPVICIGEEVRNPSGDHLKFIENQLRESLSLISSSKLSEVIVAYEPLWAIGGSAKNAITAHDLHEMSLYIQKIVAADRGRTSASKLKIIYGGSVKPENAAELSQNGNMSGFLVGGASLKAEDFLSIAKQM